MRTILALALCAIPGFAAEAPRVLKPAEGGVGRFVASDLLREFKTPLVVVALTNDTCPLCKKYVPTLQKLEKEFTARNVTFLFVNPTDEKAVSPFQGPYRNDAKLAALLGATSTTDVFVLDAQRTIVYRGAVDDQYGLGYSLDKPKQEYLKTALGKLLDGQTPEVQATTAPGCRLDLARPATTTAITYHNRISRIVQQNCLECHRTGGVGPFSLAGYDDVVKNRGAIQQVLESGTMPPWFAAPVKAGEHSPFRNDRSLSTGDRTDFVKWLESDRPKGDEADAPAPRVFKSSWAIGEPDAILKLPKPVAIKADGIMPYQMIEVETSFDADRWVQAVEVQPEARAVVHHVIVNVIPKGAGALARLPGGNLRLRGAGEERQGYFAAYVPGNSSTILPEGQARLLPQGATLRFQMHYTPNGTATTDQTRLGIKFAKGPPSVEAKVAGIPGLRLSIPPGAEHHQEVAKLPVPWDVTLNALMPHMHVRGQACKYELRTPDGKTRTLLDVPRYDFNWQLRYQFAEPVSVPKGSILTFTAWYDNSAKNPANPDPTKTVKWGPQTYDEMMLGYVEYTVDRSKKADLDTP